MDWKLICEEADKAEGGTANMAFIAGICVGLATTNRYPLLLEDRIYLAKAGEYLRRIACTGTSDKPKVESTE